MAIWMCSIDTTEQFKELNYRWIRKANTTILEIKEKETEDKSIVKIEKRKNSYKIQFINMSHFYFGNTEFPKSVIIEKGKNQCSVTY